MSKWLNTATGMSPAAPFTTCELANVTLCAPLESPTPLYVVVHNSLPVGRTVPVRLPIVVNAVRVWRRRMVAICSATCVRYLRRTSTRMQ